jgi:hypothetical protein
MKAAPTPTQLAALKDYAKRHGRYWKMCLRQSWETGRYADYDDWPSLQRVRNDFGPTWLKRFRLASAPITIRLNLVPEEHS